jgi:exodeoxyribonuclease III
MLTLGTYNVNSIRARLDRVIAWLGRTKYDVVCLQELKVRDEQFPCDMFEQAGWHCAMHGQRAYSGVAILSRSPLADVRIVSAYAPNGQIVGSTKWEYKLEWLGRLNRWLERNASPSEPLLIAGYFNGAPEDRDVARPEE